MWHPWIVPQMMIRISSDWVDYDEWNSLMMPCGILYSIMWHTLEVSYGAFLLAQLMPKNAIFG